jgi:ribosomal protein S18 acetylase RimI-like enzyme
VTFTATVRRAVGADVEVLQELECAARAGIDDARGGRPLLDSSPAVGNHWSERISDDDTIVLVALIDEVPVGYLEVVSPLDDEIAQIRQIFVHPGAREIGLGELLVETTAAMCAQRGNRRLDAHALPGDRETKNLFERLGMTARLITVSRALGGSAP